MDESTKRAIKKTVLSLRRRLEREDIPAVLKQHGIFPDGRRVPIEKLAPLDDNGRKRRERLEAAIDREVHAVGGDQKAGIERYAREVAFTYLNRLVALRSMEVRELIDECIRTRDDYAGRSLRHHRFLKEYPRTQFDAEDTDSLKAFLRNIFRELHEDIEILFDPEDEYSIIMPSLQALRECIHALTEDIPEEAFREPELIGWVYQYFQTEEKNRVFEEVRTKKKKIEGDDIVPATSLYTERYMVDYLVQNSLGAIWMEMYPDSKLCENWPYFVKDQDLKPREHRPVKSLKFLDPACGSGHFLLVAFDLLVQMYEEEARLASEGKIPNEWAVPEEQVATAILESNLHGIDIDLRSVQLSWLVLYLRLREHQESVGAPKSIPAKVNLVAADASLLDTPEFLSWCQERFKDEPYAFNIIKGIVGRLRNLSEIGSLAMPEKDLKELIHKEKERLRSALMKDEAQTLIQYFSPEEREELTIEKITDDQFWDGVLNQVTQALDDYYQEAAERGDTHAQILTHEASRGFKFLQLCNKRYDVVATNPPYMGSKNMGKEHKAYVQRVYPEGKRDLYAAFIQRNMEWTKECGVVAMVTQQSWMFLRSFVKMREEILKQNCIQTLAHLGEHAFDDPAAAGAFVVLFTIANEKPMQEHRLVAFRLIAPESSSEKKSLILKALGNQIAGVITNPIQNKLLSISNAPLVYWFRDYFFELLINSRHVKDIAEIRQGLATADNLRFVRYFWEVPEYSRGKKMPDGVKIGRWFPYEKGGGYRKWHGLRQFDVDWEEDGRRIKRHIVRAYPYLNGKWGWVAKNAETYFKKGLTYTQVARGSLGMRLMEGDGPYGHASNAVFAQEEDIAWIIAVLNTRVPTYLLRGISSKISFEAGHVSRIPLPSKIPENISEIGLKCISLMMHLSGHDITERENNVCSLYRGKYTLSKTFEEERNLDTELIGLSLHSTEGYLEHCIASAYNLNPEDIDMVLDETGTPAGWHPLVEGYDKIPDVCDIPKDGIEYIKRHERIHPSGEELQKTKSFLSALYRSGPGVNIKEFVEVKRTPTNSNDEGDAESLMGKRIHIPAETFLEELSVKMGLHPISIYWLLKEMREEEGLVCWPECKRYVEDYFTVMILQMLGFRWPKQVEANEPVPDWADVDGIIPVTEHTDEKTLFERIRDRIGAEFGEDRIGEIEAEFADILYNAASKKAEIKGKTHLKKKITLAQWLGKDFFKRYTSQFKKRPIAWHLSSSNGTFQVLLFYHKISQDMLKNLRNRYLARVQSYYSTLLDRARREEAVPGGFTAGKLTDIQLELEEFANKLDEIINMPYEPLIDDGVRVNIAPLQKVGVLASPVLAAKDVDRAIADHNRWREDDKEQNTIWRF